MGSSVSRSYFKVDPKER